MFISCQPLPSWCCARLTPFSSTVIDFLTRLEHVVVRYGGSSNESIYIVSASIDIVSSEITDSLNSGIRTYNSQSLVEDTLCGSFSGLSKVYRACGYRVGWVVFSGNRENAGEYLHALELLSALRLCSNVPGQWAVQTALGGFQSINELVAPGGKLFESRQAVIDGVADSEFLELVAPAGAMYAFPRIRTDRLPEFDDYQFALDLLEHKHVLVAPGVSFNVPFNDHFRLTTLPEPAIVADALGRVEELLHSYLVTEV